MTKTSKLTRFELLLMVTTSIEPVLAIPQVIKIYNLKSAKEFFLWTWLAGLLANILWLIYGIKIKKIPVILTGSLWVIIHSLMITGIVIYN